MLLLLASASPRRRDLLAQIGVVPDQQFAPEIDESIEKGELPVAYARRIAEEKIRVAAERHKDGAILAADTVVYAGRRIFPKTEDAAEAASHLARLSGRRHHVVTAVALRAGGRVWVRVVDSVVQFRRLSEEEQQAYLASGEWRGVAGGYAIQGKAGAFVSFLRGSYSGVVGLPLCETAGLLRQVNRYFADVKE